MFDTIITGGKVLDGSGSPAFSADIALKNGKIAAIGRISGEAVNTIDATGCFVSPGFIDIHRHGDAAVFRPDYGRGELFQGLTSVVNGACGVSLVPFGPAHREELLAYLEPITGQISPEIPTASLRDYFSALEGIALPLHVGMMVGHGTIRAGLFGYGEGEPEDLGPIHRALEQALSQGALGISLGLGYAPECFTTTKGLIAALQPLKNGKIPLTVHMRQEGGGVCRSVEEIIAVGKALNCPVHISHLKAMGRENWKNKIPRALSLMERGRQEGVDISCDVYLYDAGSTQLLHLLPPEYLKGGVEAVCARLSKKENRDALRQDMATRRDFDNIASMVGWENIMLSALHKHESLLGKTLAEAAEELRMDPVDCLCHILVEENCAVTMIDRIACEEDICTILAAPHASVISDSTYPTAGLPHPRVYGSYVRLFERFVLEKKALSLEEAVKKITSLPAGVMGLKGKGVLQVGADADINIFRPEDLHERATYLDPRRESLGPDTVLVGGEAAILRGQWTGRTNGHVLRR